MAPQSERIEVPDALSLERRQVCAPNTDEPMLLRDEHRHVLAKVETWTPDLPN